MTSNFTTETENLIPLNSNLVRYQQPMPDRNYFYFYEENHFAAEETNLQAPVPDRIDHPLPPPPPPEIANQTNLDTNHTFPIENGLSNRTYSLQSSLCGFPAFCSSSAQTRCFNTTLATCDECNYAGAVTFGVVVAFLGLIIVAANGLVLLQVVRKKNKGNYDKIKASLAVADMLTGFQPLVVSLYNLHWTLDSTASELDQTQLELRGSPQAIAGGIFYLFGFSSSLYHLVLLSQQRVFALRWPLKYNLQKARTVDMTLAIVWLSAILSSVAPRNMNPTKILFYIFCSDSNRRCIRIATTAWFPEVYIFTYSHTIFLFNFTLTNIGFTDFVPLAVMVIITYIIPFLMMTCFVIASVILIRKNSSQSEKLCRRRNENQAAHNKREVSLLKTVALMQAGFTTTLVPLVIVVMMSYSGALTCNTMSTPYVACFYLSMSNSLVNVLVYSIREKNFRKSIVRCLSSNERPTRASGSHIYSKKASVTSHTHETRVVFN